MVSSMRGITGVKECLTLHGMALDSIPLPIYIPVVFLAVCLQRGGIQNGRVSTTK